MVAELQILHILLLAAMVVAPATTSRLFLGPSRLHDLLHALAFSITASGLLLGIPLLTYAWLCFCVFGFGLFLRQRSAGNWTLYQLATCVPYVFSLIAATWLVSGANGYGLLDYGKAFSYYAALHGHVLGWTMVAGLAFLANKAERFTRFYLVGVFACLLSFLLIAFGIDGIRYIKPIGVFGLTVILVLSQVLLLVLAKGRSTLALSIACVSLAGFVLTMTLAWQNEFGALAGMSLFGARAMVSIHGLVNGFIVAPCFVLSIFLAHPTRHP